MASNSQSKRILYIFFSTLKIKILSYAKVVFKPHLEVLHSGLIYNVALEQQKRFD